MAYSKRAYLEHVALRVEDLEWHLRFFHDVLGMTVRDEQRISGLRQVWTTGGLQLIEDAATKDPGDYLAHLGVMVEDVDEVLRAAQAWNVTSLPQGANWLVLPGGLVVEILQASGQAVAEALAVNPRA